MASNQRYGCYVTTGVLTQGKVDSFRNFLRGVRQREGIADTNPSDKVYDYNNIDNSVTLCQTNKLSLLYQPWRSPLKQAPFYWRDAPYNVPIVTTNDTRPDLNEYYYYLDPNYIILCDEAVKSLSLWIKALPVEKQKVFIGLFGSFAVTGDYDPYKGVPKDSKFIIPNDTWTTHVHAEAQKFVTVNKSNNPWLPIALNPNNSAEDWEFDLSAGATLLKIGELGHGFGASGEGTFFRRLLAALLINPELIFFSESEGVQLDPSWTPQDFFPLVVSFVSGGGKILSVAATDNITDISLAFLNLYAGGDEGGYSYMRDSLDYADKNRFPESIYGPVIDPARLNAYNAQVKKVNDDPVSGQAAKDEKLSGLLENYINLVRKAKVQAEYALRGYLFKEDSIHENDGNVDLHPGNYEVRLKMKVFEGNGLHRIGDNQEAFGQSCRAIKYAAWDYDGSDITEIKVIYFDTKAAWSLRAAQGDGATLVANINCGNTQKWVTQVFPITNFIKGGINNNDVVISALRGKPIVQIIEVK